MGIIYRIGLLILTMINVIILVFLSIISPRWYAVYLAYITDRVFKTLWQNEGQGLRED